MAEGEALYQYARSAAAVGPCLEIGSYCGKSSVYLGLACKQTMNTLYAVDHHRGSEEHQRGESYHDSELYDVHAGQMDSFPAFRRTLALAQLEDSVVPLVAASELVLRDWRRPLGLVFVDGGHSDEAALRDCLGWSENVAAGGYLAIHDIFERPEEGGQAPYLAMQAVLEHQHFTQVDRIQSLVVLQRMASAPK